MTARRLHELTRRLRAALPGLAGQSVLIVGDIMLDRYIAGQVERISPEAPVPVVRVTDEWRLLGGAGNVARNIVSLGGQPSLVAVSGQDAGALELRAQLEQEGVQAALVPDPSRQTTLKTRIIAQNQQVCRVDKESAAPLSGPVLSALLEAVAERLPHCRVVILSDYGKGVITPDFMAGYLRLLAGLPERPLTLVDPKPVNAACYQGLDLLTPNAKEAGELAGLPAGSLEQTLAAGRSLMASLELPRLLVTLGAQGMALFEKDGVKRIPTFAKKVFDVTGAGDTVIAAVGLGLAAGLDHLSACLLANYAAGIVVGQVGAAVAGVAEIAAAIDELPEPDITVL